MEIRTGGCLCGRVRFEARGHPRGIVYCHCKQCRRQTGHYYAATDVENDGLTIEGGEHLTWFAASDFARRGFCRHCGSALFWKNDSQTRTSIMAGSFDDPSELTARAHIYVADKGDYYTIDDGLPQFPGSNG